MADDDYELIPHQEILDLKKELEKLKISPTPESRESMEKLTDAINNLLTLFKQAGAQMNIEEQEATLVEAKLKPLMDKIDQVLDQNQKIAEGVVTLAEMVKDLRDRRPSAPMMPPPRPMMRPMSPPPSGFPPRPPQLRPLR